MQDVLFLIRQQGEKQGRMEDHLRNLVIKLNAHNAAELVDIALQGRLVAAAG